MYGRNVDQVLYDGIYTVTGISEDGKWYGLKSGLYLTTGKEYVLFLDKLPEQSSYLVKVAILTSISAKTVNRLCQNREIYRHWCVYDCEGSRWRGC